MSRVFIIIPGFNESKHVVDTLRAVRAQGFSDVVFVDDGSSDNSSVLAFNEGVWVLRHDVNLGKGAALKTGCDFAIERGAGILVLMDSDGQHSALDIKKLLLKLKGKDIVFGYRSFSRDMPVVMRVGNFGLTFLTKLFFGMSLRDTQSGFRCFTSSAYGKLAWQSKSYAVETEMIALASRHKLRYSQVRIKTIYHDAHKGTTPIDGVKILFNMLRWRFF